MLINPYIFSKPAWGTEGDAAWDGSTTTVNPLGGYTVGGSVSYSGGNMVLQAGPAPWYGDTSRQYQIAKSIAALTRPFTIEAKLTSLTRSGNPNYTYFYCGFGSTSRADCSTASPQNYAGTDRYHAFPGNNSGTGYASGLSSPYEGPRYWRFRLNAADNYTFFTSLNGTDWTDRGTFAWGGWITGAPTYFFIAAQVGANSYSNGYATATVDYIRQS